MSDLSEFDMCASLETAILDYFDGTLNEPERRRVEMHVASCAACHAFWRAQKEVDALLSEGLRQPALASDFTQQMIERAKAVARTRAVVGLETEVDEALAGFRKILLHRAVLSLLDGLGVLTVAAIAIMFCYELLTHSALFSGLSSQQVSFYGATAVGLVALLGGVCYAFKERIRTVLDRE